MADLSIVVPSEAPRLSESLTPRRYGDATPLAERPRLTDTVTARRYGDATPTPEDLAIPDVVSAGLTPISPTLQQRFIPASNATTFKAPADWPGVADVVECIGGGGSGSHPTASTTPGLGGGGGAYAKATTISAAGGGTLQVGAGGFGNGAAGQDTWFNGASLAASSCGAKGGDAGRTDGVTAQGGQASASVGSTKYSGGNGGATAVALGGSGGGSAAGPTGAGYAGANAHVACYVGSGGGGTGGGGTEAGGTAPGVGGIGQDSTAGGAGGTSGAVNGLSGSHGSGGGGAYNDSLGTVTSAGGQGGAGVEWGARGAGGGGGGAAYATVPRFSIGGNGGQAGGGGGGGGGDQTNYGFGGQGGDGLIVLTYTPSFVLDQARVSEELTVQLVEYVLSADVHRYVDLTPFRTGVWPLGVDGGTTSSGLNINTTTCDLIVLAVSYDATAGVITAADVSDNKGNTYTALDSAVSPGSVAATRLFYCQNPTVGTGHTFTVTKTGAKIHIGWLGCRGSSQLTLLDAQVTGGQAASDVLSSAPIYPRQDAELFVCSLGAEYPAATLVSSNGWPTSTGNSTSSTLVAFGVAWQIVGAPLSHAWAWLGTARAATAMAAFIPAATPDTLRVSDTATAQLVVPGADLTATPTETLTLRDGGVTPSDGVTRLEGVLHVVDTVTASMQAPPGGDLSLSLADTVHVTDTATVALDPLQAAPSDLLHVSDSAQATLTPLQAAGGETGRVTDTVQAALPVLVASPSPSELLRVTETLTASLDPLLASVSETVRVSDPIAASMDLVAALADSVRVSDAIQSTLTPLQASLADVVHVLDLVATGSDLMAFLAEAIRVTDPVTTALTPLLVALPETVHVSETGVVALTPLQAALAETIRVTDTVAALSDTLAASATDTVRVSDALTARLTPLQGLVIETVHAAEAVTAGLTPLERLVPETARATDTITAQLGAGLTPLHPAVLTETVHVTDTVTAQLGAPVATPPCTSGAFPVDVVGAAVTRRPAPWRRKLVNG